MEDLLGSSLTRQDIFMLYRDNELSEGSLFIRKGKTYQIIKGKLKEVTNEAGY
jgi:hypothetical protein